jgi:hypothetical protein
VIAVRRVNLGAECAPNGAPFREEATESDLPRQSQKEVVNEYGRHDVTAAPNEVAVGSGVSPLL